MVSFQWSVGEGHEETQSGRGRDDLGGLMNCNVVIFSPPPLITPGIRGFASACETTTTKAVCRGPMVEINDRIDLLWRMADGCSDKEPSIAKLNTLRLTELSYIYSLGC